MNTIPVLYCCEECCLTYRRVNVPVRNPSSDVVKWMEQVVITAIAFDHRVVSPRCRATRISDTLIWMHKDGKYVGHRPESVTEQEIEDGIQVMIDAHKNRPEGETDA